MLKKEVLFTLRQSNLNILTTDKFVMAYENVMEIHSILHIKHLQ